ncbi:Fanconi anemia group B protein [Corvus cornix cornix]|nr:PREDICTED: Fanconi anemia group B protein [Corvus brachyrhynchos]XP_010392728.1 Fanconi anemia group B protein [Corvus cornix cornix]XP_017583969.1 PREDICTED: Fanconi anemia group B protein [Corvus brachyrhynchos]XP_017583970.1 PREDICTED: Fanconi anemia group B protein [Corvus brachyrhynchos]XP_019138653.1 Fanconi anemia group B protein [Corvus cornix cornix]XP_039406678.1 Fanconi anemia group B protein [Corvus cornix cornix]
MLLSEQDQFLSYNGEVLVFQLSKPKHAEEADDKTMNLCVRRMAFNRDTKLFVQKSSGVFSMHASDSKIEMICCSCTTDSRTGIILPCILMKKKKRNNVKYFVLLLHSSNQFEQSFYFKLDYELKEDIRLFTGPSVLWRQANKLFYISSNTCVVQSAPVQLSSVVWTGEIVDEGTAVLGIRTACLPETEDADGFSVSDRAIWGSEFFGYAIETQKMLAGTCFMPHAYSRVVSSVYICRSERWKKQLRISLVAITHKNQLIWFQNGVPKGVCELPYAKPCSVKPAVTSSNDLLFVVYFASGNSCVVQRRDSLQVASKWPKVKCILVDDFIGSGSEQLLLLFKDDSNTDVLSTFKITDLGEVNYASSINYKHDVPAAEGLQENGLLTVRALETRLQAGWTSVRELQQHLGLQKRVILESCRALIDLVEERTHVLPNAKQEGLVSLWDDVENPPHSLSKETALVSEVPEHFTEELWQRVVGDSLVVGVKLTESFYLSLSEVSLSLVMDQDFSSISPIIKCQSKIIKLNKAFSALAISSSQIEPPPKKMKLDLHSKNYLRKEFPKRSSSIHLDGARTLTAVTSLSPLLAFHRVCCVVLLHARKQNHQNDSLQQSKKIAVVCGKILLSLEDISNGRYSVKMLRDNSYCTGSVEDILAVLAVSVRFSFQIVSSDFTLTPVSSWLLGEMECTPFKECQGNIFCHKAGNVHGTIFNWTLKNPFEGVLTIFCRNLTILFQCLHSLTRVLPPSCCVKLLRSGSKAVLTEQLALALEKEMLTLKNSLFLGETKAENSLTWGNESGKKINNSPLASLLDTEEGVQQFRKKFQNEQEENVQSMNQTMNGALYQKTALNIAEAQLSSDMIVWRLSKS